MQFEIHSRQGVPVPVWMAQRQERCVGGTYSIRHAGALTANSAEPSLKRLRVYSRVPAEQRKTPAPYSRCGASAALLGRFLPDLPGRQMRKTDAGRALFGRAA